MLLSRDADGTYRVFNLATRLTQVFSAAPGGGPALLREVRDAHDNALRLEYEGARLARIADTAGREVLVKWARGRIGRLEVRAGGRLEQWVDYLYSSLGCLTAAVDALGHADEYAYDRWGRMIATSIKTGIRFEYAYETGTGRCERTSGPNGLYAIELHADKNAQTTTVEGEEPRVYTWNDQGLMTREALPDGTVFEERAYDEDCFLIAKVNGEGAGTQYWYDARGNRIRTVDATGNVTAVEYDDHDLPTRRITADGLVTQFTRDARGALTAVTYPSGQSYALTYDHRGRLTGVHGASGLVRGFEYDAQHNVVAETDGRGARTTFTYDGMGRPITSTDALGRATRVTYDRLGRRLSVRLPDGTMTSAAYNPMGNVVREVDALGRPTAMEYAGMGVLSRLVDAEGRTWSFKYTSKERLSEIKNPRGELYAFTYDEAGRVIEEKTFDGRLLRYQWSSAGRLAQIDYPDQSFRAFSHDREGRVLSETGSDKSAIAYERDRMGRIVAAVLEENGQRIETRLERDALGRVVVERQGDRAVRFSYDARGRRAQRVMPDGATTQYAYDAEDALSGVEHNGYSLAIERDAIGREIRRGDATGRLSIRSEYDALDRLIEQRATAPSPGEGVPAVLVQRQWQYDQAGRVT
jgi:YD repeat-containing protein